MSNNPVKRVMRALIFRKYGDPREVMEIVDNLDIPELNKNEVLIKVEYSSVNAADKHMVRANFLIVRLVLGLFRPSKKNRVLGMDVAGTIQEVGGEVEGFQIGNEVAADIRKMLGGGFAEYAIVRAVDLVMKPANVSFEQAAAVPISGQAAMMGLILCTIKSGDRVLINGSSGGVGSFAVQIAKAQGAHVTAMCSEKKANAVRSWGVDELVDYSKTSVGELNENTFDAVLDTASFGSPGVFARVLKNNGRYVLVGGNFYNMLRVKFFGRFYAKGKQQFRSIVQEVKEVENIKTVLEMISQGKVNPAIQKTISLEQVPDAIHLLEQRTVIGKIIVDLNIGSKNTRVKQG
jgi:NADPH:quinone reductase-like Zn-dependent oxidoreductase